MCCIEDAAAKAEASSTTTSVQPALASSVHLCGFAAAACAIKLGICVTPWDVRRHASGAVSRCCDIKAHGD